ncbi:hypothetical protein HK104_005757 [Borealophlyctis nickersoniae]|nr:hypothetical protein HK104_005757 [Borealophlyctis nickersoniae]
MSDGIRSTGGAMGRREAAEEERYALKHEREVIEKLRAELAKREKEFQEKAAEIEKKDNGGGKSAAGGAGSSGSVPNQAAYSPGKTGGGDAFSKREAANEERWIREHEKTRK